MSPSGEIERPDVTPYDAILIVAFGGPESIDDVVPFLRNVTKGKGIPDERLAEVGEHYYKFGGSPINEQTRQLVAQIKGDLAAHDVSIPVYWGCRNWDPYLADTLARMRDDGIERALAITTSAFSSYSGCRQYRENLYDAAESIVGAPQLDRARAYFNHPGYVEAVTEGALAALSGLPAGATILFVTHSIPETMDATSGPEGKAYSTQHQQLMSAIVNQLDQALGRTHRHELVFCSRSGAPGSRWLEPDVNDRMRELSAEGVSAVLLVPFGFISDHMEVIYDLDTEAKATADELGMGFARAATASIHPAFVAIFKDLLIERAAKERGRQVTGAVAFGKPALDLCGPSCCPNPRSPRPAMGEAVEVPSQ